ncbi:MAG: TrmB family transcriptional regulator [Candidatus Ranarchaeia archaeon]
MPDPEYIKKALKSLGLTDYETQAYLTILSHGKIPASEISRDSGIPYSRVYDVLKRLDDKGWLTLIPGKPNKYEANPPKDTLRSIKLARVRDLEEKENLLTKELQPLFERKGGSERSSVVILHGETNLLSKIRDIIDNVRDSVFVAFPTLGSDMLILLATWLKSLKARNITVKIMTPSLPKEVKPLFSYAEVRIAPGLYASGIIADKKETLLILPESEDYLKNPLQWAIFSEHRGLALLSKQYFDHLWDGVSEKENIK